MAIKPITNENANYESRVNRESQTSIRSEKGNPKVVIKKPGGQNAGKGFSFGVKETRRAEKLLPHRPRLNHHRVEEERREDRRLPSQKKETTNATTTVQRLDVYAIIVNART